MSDHNRPRLRRCKMCRQRAVLVRHGKCIDCRVLLMYGRWARKGKYAKFRSQGGQREG